MAKILIVDDSEVARIEIRKILKSAGHDVLEGTDGVHGIKMATANEDVSIVFADYNMPDMDGLSMLDNIRQIEAHKETFFGVLTTESSAALKEEGRAMGVKVWIVKPVSAKKLLKITDMILKDVG